MKGKGKGKKGEGKERRHQICGFRFPFQEIEGPNGENTDATRMESFEAGQVRIGK